MNRALLVLVAACAHAPPPAVTKLVATDIGTLDNASAVVALGDATFVFRAAGVAILRGGILVATGEAPAEIRSATTISALDGDGRWVVAVATNGTVWRVTQTAAFESIGERLGFTGAKVVALVGAGKTIAAQLDQGIASSTDAHHMQIVTSVPTTTAFAAAVDRLAFATATTVELWDLAKATRRSFAVSGVRSLAFLDADSLAPRLAIATADQLAIESGGVLRKVSAPAALSSIVAAGPHLWIGAADRMYLYDGRTMSPTTSATHAPRPLYGSPTGDVWVAGNPGLAHYAIGGSTRAAHAADAGWQTSIAPVFQRVCAHCHLPGGDAGIDLSSAASWSAEKNEIKGRVLVTKTMPPAGTEMSDADRRAIEAWLTK